ITLSVPSSLVSRRSFMRMAGVAASMPIFSEAHFAFAAQQPSKPTQPASQMQAMKQMYMSIPKDAVLINANENPLGPCEAARAAIASVAAKGARYAFLAMMTLMEVFALQ